MNAALRQLIAPLAIVFCAVLAGCNGTIGALEPAFSVSSNDEETDKDAGQQVIGKPYKVGGRWYHPKEDEEYDKSGLASWYGSKFHGRRTASGEAFDQNALTAAHPTLPLPSYVRVTVEKTGKSTVVRVNDRGPFTSGRIIDVSKAAAEELGFRRAGHAKVRVEYIGPAPAAGGDKETRIAAAQDGKKPSKSGRGFFGFGKKDEDAGEDDGRNIKVRLASSAPEPRKSDPLPGVAQRYIRQPEPEVSVTATAFADADEEPEGALKAVAAIAPPPVAPAPVEKKIEAQPLPETAAHVSADRFSAHDMFATGVVSEARVEEAAAQAAATQPTETSTATQ